MTKDLFTRVTFVMQLDAIFVALKLQLKIRMYKPAAISVQFYVYIASV